MRRDWSHSVGMHLSVEKSVNPSFCIPTGCRMPFAISFLPREASLTGCKTQSLLFESTSSFSVDRPRLYCELCTSLGDLGGYFHFPGT